MRYQLSYEHHDRVEWLFAANEQSIKTTARLLNQYDDIYHVEVLDTSDAKHPKKVSY